MNKGTYMGYLADDIKMSNSGETLIGKFTLAIKRPYSKSKKEGQKDTDWVSFTVFGNRAENMAKFFHKGDKVLVEGALRTGSYTDKGGILRKSWTIQVSNFYFTAKQGQSKQPQIDEDSFFEQGDVGNDVSESFSSIGTDLDVDDLPSFDDF